MHNEGPLRGQFGVYYGTQITRGRNRSECKSITYILRRNDLFTNIYDTHLPIDSDSCQMLAYAHETRAESTF